ncbi:MAG: hypothetical protein D6685_14605 [Bacteroidetes bacterium]|nr:MAG: hypothetical protein D6685_14605 [Bacteroidota bacterium]
MITLYRPAACSFCDDVADRLRAAVLAHRVMVLDAEEPVPGLPASVRPPVLVEGRQAYTDRASIEAFLDEVEHEVMMGRQISGDACYLDPDTGTCL